VSRILVLIPLLTYLAAARQASLWQDLGWQSGVFTAVGIGIIVMITAILGRRLARQSGGIPDYATWSRFQTSLFLARLFIVVWFGFCTLALGYASWIDQLLDPIEGTLDLHLPGLILACTPPVLGFIGLWWAAFPLERLMQERSILSRMDDGLPVHALPDFGRYFFANLRLQMLFVLIPVAAIMLLGDIATILGSFVNYTPSEVMTESLSAVSVLLVLLVGPVFLVRILPTSSLDPGSRLRADLEQVERITRQRCRDIRVWHTNHTMSNAMVMGIARPARYVLMSDLLIETLAPRELQAVYAHEAGHVRYRHLLWYVLFFSTYLMVLTAPAGWMFYLVLESNLASEQMTALGVAVVITTVYIYMFGVLARFFERQADAYAARTLELIPDPGEPVPVESQNLRPEQVPVSKRGARGFANALSRVVTINRMPSDPRPRFGTLMQRLSQWLAYRTSYFLHPSPAERLEHLAALCESPEATRAFDRRAGMLFLGLILYAVLLSVITVLWLAKFIN